MKKCHTDFISFSLWSSSRQLFLLWILAISILSDTFRHTSCLLPCYQLMGCLWKIFHSINTSNSSIKFTTCMLRKFYYILWIQIWISLNISTHLVFTKPCFLARLSEKKYSYFVHHYFSGFKIIVIDYFCFCCAYFHSIHSSQIRASIWGLVLLFCYGRNKQ